MTYLFAKFEVCIFSRSRDIKGTLNFKTRSREHCHALFWPFFYFFCFSIPYGRSPCKIWRERERERVYWPSNTL